MNKLILIVMLLFSVGVMAQPMVWTGDGDGISFNDADNWDTNTKPMASNQLLIENDSVVVRSMALAYSLELNDVELTILSDLTLSNGDTFAISGSHCAIYNDGNILISQAGNNSQDYAIELTFSSLFNRGDINIKNSTSGLNVESHSTLLNENVLIVQSQRISLRIGNNSSAINNDSIVISNVSGSSNCGMSVAAVSEFTNNGLIEIFVDGLFSTGITCNPNSSTFTNYGNVEIKVLQGRGVSIFSHGVCQLLDGDLRIILEDDADGVSVESSSSLVIAASARLIVQNVPQDFWIDVQDGSTLTCDGDLIGE